MNEQETFASLSKRLMIMAGAFEPDAAAPCDAPVPSPSDFVGGILRSFEIANERGDLRFIRVVSQRDFQAVARLDDMLTWINLSQNKPVRQQFIGWLKDTGRAS